ncbi:MAG: DNA repair protein RecO [Candidatus Izemoplasmatales bacterium]|nr:DNA repair protein RecO [Candidatus Izemoplasmatales bacterium]
MNEYQGIILKKISYKESSEIIYLYTDQGLISVLIHGSKKIKSPFLNLTKVLNHVKVNVSGKNLLTFRDGEVLSNFSIIHEDLEKYTYCLHLCEMLYYFSTHDHDHEKLLAFLVKILPLIKEEKNYIPYINMVELKLLYLLGVNPNLHSCIVCESQEELTFSVKDGGVLCRNHQKEVSYNNQTLNAIRKLYYHDINKTKEISIDVSLYKDIRNLIDEYYEFHLNYFSKTRKMLKGLIGY